MKFFTSTTSFSFAVMQSGVVSPGHHPQVFWTVVPFVSIDVVYDFILFQRAAQHLLGHHSVLMALVVLAVGLARPSVQ